MSELPPFPSDDEIQEEEIPPQVTDADFAPLDTLPPDELPSEIQNIDDLTMSSRPTLQREAEGEFAPASTFETFSLPESKPAQKVLDEIKEYAAESPIGIPQVDPKFPFDLRIEGELDAAEKEKLLDFLKENKLGIRAEEIEPQLDAGRILIPRISEYVGVVLVQMLHAAHLSFELSPTPADEMSTFHSSEAPKFQSYNTHHPHQAESIPVVRSIQELGDRQKHPFTPIDNITAAAILRTSSVEARDSIEYQELLDNLQREIRFKAYRKGASAVVEFGIQLNPLGPPGFYRVTAFGTAIRFL